MWVSDPELCEDKKKLLKANHLGFIMLALKIISMAYEIILRGGFVLAGNHNLCIVAFFLGS